jgi:hypothetical protein
MKVNYYWCSQPQTSIYSVADKDSNEVLISLNVSNVRIKAVSARSEIEVCGCDVRKVNVADARYRGAPMLILVSLNSFLGSEPKVQSLFHFTKAPNCRLCPASAGTGEGVLPLR